ncbi:long-chain acyl-CoA synthetase [Acrasis kona]|uniref:Long-chain acyl-CoA synthetase n=1 Tax=Acrasis kona TaxID=1008807 RepID=A0AAW2ZJK2_9EUKA
MEQVVAQAQINDERRTLKSSIQSLETNDFVRRNAMYPEALLLRSRENVPTAYHSFKRSVETNPNKYCMGRRTKDPATGVAGPYEFITYAQAYETIKNFASGLRSIGVEPEQHLGIFCKNRMEWQLTSEACHTQSIVTIALYDTLGGDAVSYIMNHGEIVCLCMSREEINHTSVVLSSCEFVRHVICYDVLSPQEFSILNEAKPGVRILTFDEVVKIGSQSPYIPVEPTADSTATIMYTSGTTGQPKGVILTHGNLISFANSTKLILPESSPEGEVMLSFLPLGHIFERCVEVSMFEQGGCVGYYQGDVTKLADDLKELRPTILVSVPRVLDRLYDSIKTAYNNLNFMKKYLFDQAFAAKEYAIRNNGSTPIWDRIIFSNIKANVGGRVKYIISGGAPLRSVVQEYLRIALDCSVVQGYGLTETCSGGSLQIPGQLSTSNIGPPIPSNEIKLVSVPEMNYLNTNNPPTGEICIRGLNVSKGYYKDPEKTAEVFDKDGWFHTGDVGMWNADGTLTIIDRVKNMFKLSQGEYVAAENLEMILGQSPFLTRLWIYGDSTHNSLVAVGVVNMDYTKQWAREHHIKDTLQDVRTKEAVLRSLASLAKKKKLQGFEYVKNIYLVDVDFDSPKINGTTPTLKLKRNVLQAHFKQQIEDMYQELQMKNTKPESIKSKL